MSKIAIVSQPDQGILVDISGCIDIQEAREHLVSSLEVARQMPQGTKIDLKLGAILLEGQDVDQIMMLAQQAGVSFNQVFANNNETKANLQSRNLTVGKRSLSTSVTDVPALSETLLSQELLASAEATPIATENTKATTETTVTETKPAETTIGFAGPGCESTSDTAGSVTVSKSEETPQIPQVLYVKQNLRSGQSVSHKGHLVIFGDVNPGAEVIADGDITVWGALRGVAHAGVNGNQQAEIRALRLHPIQLRIAHAIARAPDKPKTGGHIVPETARIVAGQIRIQANIPE